LRKFIITCWQCYGASYCNSQVPFHPWLPAMIFCLPHLALVIRWVEAWSKKKKFRRKKSLSWLWVKRTQHHQTKNICKFHEFFLVLRKPFSYLLCLGLGIANLSLKSFFFIIWWLQHLQHQETTWLLMHVTLNYDSQTILYKILPFKSSYFKSKSSVNRVCHFSVS